MTKNGLNQFEAGVVQKHMRTVLTAWSLRLTSSVHLINAAEPASLGTDRSFGRRMDGFAIARPDH
jgi:hypothetical protein